MRRVLVTGVGSGGHGEQILKALAMAEPGKYAVFGADANPAVKSRLVEGQVHPLPLAKSVDYIDAVLALALKLEAGTVFHGSEPELSALTSNKEKFDRAGIFLATNRQELVEIALNKQTTNEVLKDLGFGVPRSWLIHGGQSLKIVDKFPVVVKPHLGGGGSRDVFIAHVMSRDIVPDEPPGGPPPGGHLFGQ